MKRSHDRIEAIAGAIALGEATNEERLEYRRHLSVCAACVQSLGGEHEIERTMALVSDAQQSEVWEPDLRPAIAAAAKRPSRILRRILSFGAACLGLVFGVHVLIASGFARMTPLLADPLVFNAGGARIVLEPRAPAPVTKPHPRLIVEHNVVQIDRAPIASSAISAVGSHSPDHPTQIAAVTVHPTHARSLQSDVPVWRRGSAWRTVAKTTTTSLSESAPQTLDQSQTQTVQIASAYATRDAVPLHGETSINPQPPIAAYDEGAQGTAVFEVFVDAQGAPTKCVITQSSGFASLDGSVCSAAMKVQYTPKTINGQPVAGTYRDAFTFRMADNGN